MFRKNTGDWKDLLDLIIGTIRVHIEHFGNEPNPNRIMTPTAVISVRGTTFDVSVDEDDETTEVDVEEGTVVVQHALLPTEPRGHPAHRRIDQGLQERADRVCRPGQELRRQVRAADPRAMPL